MYYCVLSLHYSFEFNLSLVETCWFEVDFYFKNVGLVVHCFLTITLNWIFTEKWMGKPSMTLIQAGRKDPKSEVEVAAMNPMEMQTKDTVFLSATSHMMWNGKPWKTWWKKKVGYLDKTMTWSAFTMTKSSCINLFDHSSFERLLGICTATKVVQCCLGGIKVSDGVPLIFLPTTELLHTWISGGPGCHIQYFSSWDY